jgi:hypothetical protein
MYRNLLIPGILLCLSFHLSAQAGKGFFAGGAILAGYTSTFVPGFTQKVLDLGISPKVGYFFNNLLALGIESKISFSGRANSYRHSSEQINVFCRLALPIGMEGKLLIWSDISSGISFWKSWDPLQFDTKGLNFHGALSAGFLLFPRPKIGLEFGLSNIFSYMKILKIDNIPYDLQYIGILNSGALTPQLGVHYYFNRK